MSAAAAKAMAAWERRLQRAGPACISASRPSPRADDGWDVSVPVYLGDAAVDDIAVQACAEAQAGTDTVALAHGEAMPGTTGGYLFLGRIPGMRPATDYTVRVVPYHPGVRVPTELTLVHWQK